MSVPESLTALRRHAACARASSEALRAVEALPPGTPIDVVADAEREYYRRKAEERVAFLQYTNPFGV